LDGAGAIAAINAALQATDNPALQSIVATTDPTLGTLTFSSNASLPFTMSIGLETGMDLGKGLANPNTVQKSGQVGVGSSADISNQASAQSAVSALATSVTALGSAQAVVGRGQNQFGYAINLAQSQLTNLTTAESRVRDADLAAEAANLTKAQILLQAGVAALAQANSAPQAVLSLLKGG
jgi:flagellin